MEQSASLILASTSPYRRELLARLGLPFAVVAPEVDESPLPGEAPEATARRLAEAKAKAVAQRHVHAVVIGSDQVAVLEGEALGKPGNYENAKRQLLAMRGKEMVFHTALSVCSAGGARVETRMIPYQVRLRDYSAEQIERYLQREQPYDCAGSARSEGLGIALIAEMRGTDPNALIGLPLIALTEMLAAHGVSVL